MLSDEVKANLKEKFKNLKENVVLCLDLDESNLSKDIKELTEEVATLSDKISIKENCNASKIKPCISIFRGEKDTGIRYCGLPSQGEFQTLIDAIFLASMGEFDIDKRVLELLKDLDEKVEFKTFVTKTCGWCPLTLKKLYQFALANDNIEVYGIDAYDFQDMAIKYNVAAVPKTVINDKVEFVGLKSDNEILGYIASVVGR